jgi:exodeoxyribonuclease V alpha subunit
MKANVFTQEETLSKLSGIVKRITFHSPDTGWTILKITPFNQPGTETAVIVHQSKVFAGATMEFYGNWTTHPKFGNQFKAVKAVELKPASANALEKYLGSGLIKGVGPVTAKAIVNYFGKDTLEVFDKKIIRLKEIAGIAEKKLEMIAEAWEEHKDIKDVMIFLQDYDISTLFATKIFKTYGKDAISVVSNNPYKLAEDIYGIGFFSADAVALRMGLGEESDQRIQAAIDHVLNSSREEGHCYLSKEQILANVNELLSLEIDEKTATILDSMEKQEKIKVRELVVKDAHESTKCYYAPSIYFDEDFIAKKVKILTKKKIKFDNEKVTKWISTYCDTKKIALSDEQQQSIAGIITHGFSLLTGGPGCGKTTTTNVLVALLIAMKKEVSLAAPTGRAAQRMTEVIGMPAKTIHRLLEWQPAKGGFKKDEDEPLRTDFIIIDESSMLDVHLAAAVFRAIAPTTQVLFIGDPNQLPAVGAGNVFHDLIASENVPCFRLTKIFRQAQASFIIRYAHDINKGIIPKITSPMANNNAWKEKIDCLFIDSEEATQEQLHFVKKVKSLAAENALQLDDKKQENDDLYTKEYSFVIPDKFQHVSIEELTQTTTHVEELKAMIKKVHPWSTLHFGMNATATIKRLYSKTIPQYYGKNVEIQILSPMTKGSLGTNNLNKLIQYTVNPQRNGVAQMQLGDRTFRVGDRIIQKRNNYDLQVFNGDIGKIIAIDNEEMQMRVEFPLGIEKRIVKYEKDALSEIDFAYAITIHKSQGSEFDVLIIPLATQHFNMLFRNLLYTGLTRGKKLVVFVGSRKALAMAVLNNKTIVRQTALQELLKK